MNFGVNPWENMFNHMLTHVKSLWSQNMIHISHNEVKHPIFWQFIATSCAGGCYKLNVTLSATVLIIDYLELSIFPMGNWMWEPPVGFIHVYHVMLFLTGYE